jgi:hypothetical protein
MRALLSRPLERTLHGRIGLRVALLFVGCAVVPLTGLGLLTLGRTTRQIDDQARERLHYDVKAVAMTGIERLRILEDQLRLVAGRPGAPPAPRRDGPATAVPDLARYLVLDDRGRVVAGTGRLRAPALSAEQAAHLAEAGVLLVRQVDSRGAIEHLLAVRALANGAALTAMAPVDHRYLWNLADAYLLPPDAQLCVFDARAMLACSDGVDAEVRALAMSVPANVERTVRSRHGDHMVRTWAVPLKGRYSSAPWVLAMMRPREVVRAPLGQFAQDFWLTLIVSLLLVMLVTIAQVRRTMLPLTRLMEGTRRLAGRDFGFHVDVESGDEFEVLARSFNGLTTELKDQFDRLEAFNLGTLAALARTVDAKSPWTAGHSERVTALAVEIGRELALPDEEIVALQRGGLVHDIGKIAIPGAILDKPAALTDAERGIMRLHPEHGARILEPIAEFAPLLPIVLEHHERWDGGGYPRGLAGERITRTARVLAVADALDAIQSDRPYRRGLPPDEAVRLIERNAGRQFDPAVVAALSRLMARRSIERGDLRLPSSQDAA